MSELNENVEMDVSPQEEPKSNAESNPEPMPDAKEPEERECSFEDLVNVNEKIAAMITQNQIEQYDLLKQILEQLTESNQIQKRLITIFEDEASTLYNYNQSIQAESNQDNSNQDNSNQGNYNQENRRNPCPFCGQAHPPRHCTIPDDGSRQIAAYQRGACGKCCGFNHRVESCRTNNLKCLICNNFGHHTAFHSSFNHF